MRCYCAVRPRWVAEADAWVGSDELVTIIGLATAGSTITLSGYGIFSRTGAANFEAEYAAPPGMKTWRSVENNSRE